MGIPTAADASLVEKLAVANRILYHQGVVDSFGHVSVRHDKSADHFLLARNMAPALVTREDVLTFDLNGAALDSGSRRVYLERFIHGEIYRARPDVQAVVHSHSPSVIPVGATRQPLRPIFHMCGFLGEGTSLFEIRDVAGDTDMLVSSNPLGVALAAALGSHSAVLISTVPSAMTLGDVTYLNAAEAAKAAATNETQVPRAWELWQREVGPLN